MIRSAERQVLQSQPYTEKVDMYSWALIAWQLAADYVPFKGVGIDEFRHRVRGHRSDYISLSPPLHVLSTMPRRRTTGVQAAQPARDRPQVAQGLRRAFDGVLGPRPVPATALRGRRQGPYRHAAAGRTGVIGGSTYTHSRIRTHVHTYTRTHTNWQLQRQSVSQTSGPHGSAQ